MRSVALRTFSTFRRAIHQYSHYRTATAKMGPFEYTPLSSATSTRILKVSQSDDDGRLQCELSELQLTAVDEMYPDPIPPPYTCLSYSWGSTTATETVICNGKAMQITTNLADALRMTLWKNPNEFLWADQICINQDDDVEKGAQVQRMTQIYDQAKTVLAWIGDEEPDTALAISWIERVAALTKGLGNDVFDDYANSDERSEVEKKERLTEEQSEALGVPFSNTEAWTAFSNFFHRSWFGRTWVVQEVLPAREAWVVCGRHSVDWQKVKAAATWYQSKAGALTKTLCAHEEPVCGIWHTASMNLAWRMRWGANSPAVQQLLGQKIRPTYRWALEELLQTFRCREASDPRDKVFALVGISELHRELDDPLLQPSYEKSVMEVYRDCWRAFLGHHWDISTPLTKLMMAIPASEEPGWPSWVPDWRVAPWLPRDCMGKVLPSMQFGEGFQNKYIHVPLEPGRDSELFVEGHVLGKIVRFSQHNHTAELITDIRADYEEFYEAYHSMFATEQYVPLGATEETARTAWTMSLHGGEMAPSLQDQGVTPEQLSKLVVEIIEFMIPQPNAKQTEGDAPAKVQPRPGFTVDKAWIYYLIDRYCGRRWYITDDGWIGIGYQDMQEGDVIAMVWGMETACVLRPVARPDGEEGLQPTYRLIGEAYCHGMNRVLDALERDEDGRPVGTKFSLV
ncbi:HET-domain-containing protein [Thozetella sp. PMI_491]|nr:HET-domain-containing protein [Thozetella sp. PMI_491]